MRSLNGEAGMTIEAVYAADLQHGDRIENGTTAGLVVDQVVVERQYGRNRVLITDADGWRYQRLPDSILTIRSRSNGKEDRHREADPISHRTDRLPRSFERSGRTRSPGRIRPWIRYILISLRKLMSVDGSRWACESGSVPIPSSRGMYAGASIWRILVTIADLSPLLRAGRR